MASALPAQQRFAEILRNIRSLFMLWLALSGVYALGGAIILLAHHWMPAAMVPSRRFGEVIFLPALLNLVILLGLFIQFRRLASVARLRLRLGAEGSLR